MNTITLKQLHNIVDIVNPQEYELIYKLLIKFIAETEPMDDEIEAAERLDNAIINGDTVGFDDIDWS